MFPAKRIEDLAHILGAKVGVSGQTPSLEAISTDSRQAMWLRPTAFFALKTQSGDGHAFAAEALQQGAVALVIEEQAAQRAQLEAAAAEAGAWVLRVASTWSALHRFAAAHRDSLKGPVVGITGSNGKTTVKEYLYHLMGDREVARSPRSFNSQLGVPLTVLGTDAEAKCLLAEVGVSEAGDMARLAPWLRPNVGIFTSMGSAHEAGFASRAEKLAEKASLFAQSDWVIAPAAQPEIAQALVGLTRVWPYAWNQPELEAEVHFTWAEGQVSWAAPALNVSGQAACPAFEAIEAQNVAAALAYILVSCSAWKPEALMDVLSAGLRLERLAGIHDWTLLNDSYSSDADSLEWALETLGRSEKAPRLALVAAPENQDNFGAWMADAVKRHGLDDWLGIGPGTEEAGGHWPSVEAFLADQPWTQGPAQGTLLLKGPRKAGLERILPYLRSQHHDTHVSLDLEALAANLRHYRGRLNGQRVMAMVKANAYGLGAVTVAKALAKHHVDYFGVAYSDEGVALRQAGIAQPILVMNPGEQSVEVLLEHRLEPELFNWTSLERYGQAFLRHPGEAPGRVHIKVDTGMHRLGFQPSQGAEVAEALRAYPGLEVVSVMSHLASAEDPQQDAFTRQQFEAFEHFYRNLAAGLGYAPLKQIANTPGTARHAYLLGDMVRLGIGLYGDSAVPEDRALLQPVVHVHTQISHLQELPAGEGLSYGHADAAPHARQIATLPMGYADGFPRILSEGRGEVFIHGQRCPVVGRVCMDMTMVDVTGLQVAIGDRVELLGAHIPLHEFAERSGTISYEVLTRLSERLGRTVWNPNA